MTPGRYRTLLLTWLLGDNETLAGDLVEESSHRPARWFWRQLLYAAVTSTCRRVSVLAREPDRMAALLCGLAMFGVLCFQATVAGSLLRALVPRASIDWGTWSPVVVALSISMAVAAGGSAGLVHSTSRLTAVGICGLGASAAAFVTTQALASSVTTFFPSIGIQLACSAASVSVLFAAATGVNRHRHPPGHSCGASSCARSPRA